MITAIIPLYNKEIEDVPSLSALVKSNKISSVIILDNSTSTNHFCDIDKVAVVNMGGNKGISKALNIGVGLADTSHILILDDDTPLRSEQIDLIDMHIDQDAAEVYLPCVYSKERLLSPYRVGKIRVTEISNPEMLRMNVGGINSGLVAQKEFLAKNPFNEELFIDFVDHDFFRRIQGQDVLIKIMQDVVLTQNYSRDQTNFDSEYPRFKLYIRDSMIYYSQNALLRQFGFLQRLWRAIRLCKKYRRTAFLFETLRKMQGSAPKREIRV